MEILTGKVEKTSVTMCRSVAGMNKLWSALKRCTIVAKKEVLYAGPFGLGLWLGGVIFIDRLNSEKSREAINKVSGKLKRDDVSAHRGLRVESALGAGGTEEGLGWGAHLGP